MLRSLSRSARRHTIELGLNERTVMRISHKHLGLYPHKIPIVQELNVGDYEQRAAFFNKGMLQFLRIMIIIIMQL